MARGRLSLAALTDLSFGEVEGTFRLLLKQAVDDIEDRPVVKKPRKIVLTLSIEPDANQRGPVERVSTSFTVKAVLPQHELGSHEMRIGAGHELMFNPESPSDPDQRTIDELVEGRVDPRTGEVKA